MPNRSHLAETSHILEVINDVFARHRDGTLSDVASRQTLSAFVKSYPAGGLLSPDDVADFDAYLDLSLQISQRATSSYDAATAACARVVMEVAVGHTAALGMARRALNHRRASADTGDLAVRYDLADLETRTFLSLGKWNWAVCDRASGLVLKDGTTHGRESEAHLRAVHAASMIAGGYDDAQA